VLFVSLTGPGESGKSTVAKQMKIIHCNGFSQSELNVFKPLIFANCISAMQTILTFCDQNQLNVESRATVRLFTYVNIFV